MPDLNWYLPLESSTSLDEMRPQWQALLEAHAMTPSQQPPRNQDAVLSFVGQSVLSPHLKLAAVLAFGSAFDVDLRLALGALAEQTWEAGLAWPDSVAAAVSDNGPALHVATRDAELGAFVLGRLAGLRETMSHDGTRLEHWHAAFWNRFLAMACRHGASDAVALALRHGADPTDNDGAAIVAAAAGPDDEARATIEDYLRVMRQLLDAAPAPAAILAIALPAAAGADGVAMLDFLVARGADLDVDGPAALAAAARHLAFDTFDLLRERGADVRAAGVDILAAAVASLDETMVETALAAGADRHAGACAALCAALSAQPWDLYGGEPDFIEARADMFALLLRHGLRCGDACVAEALTKAWNGPGVVEALLDRQDLDADSAAFIAQLAARALKPAGLPGTAS